MYFRLHPLTESSQHWSHSKISNTTNLEKQRLKLLSPTRFLGTILFEDFVGVLAAAHITGLSRGLYKITINQIRAADDNRPYWPEFKYFPLEVIKTRSAVHNSWILIQAPDIDYIEVWWKISRCAEWSFFSHFWTPAIEWANHKTVLLTTSYPKLTVFILSVDISDKASWGSYPAKLELYKLKNIEFLLQYKLVTKYTIHI